MEQDELQYQYKILNSMWQRIKSGDRLSAFLNELSTYLYMTVTTKDTSDNFWASVTEALFVLCNKYDAHKGSVEEQLAFAVTMAANDVVGGRFRLEGQKNGVLT